LCRCREQDALKQRLIDTDQYDTPVKLIGGLDISFVNGSDTDACACLVVLSYPQLEVVYEASRMIQLQLPYVSGYLAFREAPFLCELVEELRARHPHLLPQVLFVDGNGTLHPRGFGVACHIGVLTGLPTVGVAKKFLFTDGLSLDTVRRQLQSAGDVHALRGDSSGAVLGYALRQGAACTKPIYVSTGHRVSGDSAVRLVQSCSRFRVPEPIRQADLRSRAHLRKQ